MNPLVLPLAVGIARALGWEGITNPYAVLSMLSLSVALGLAGVFLGIKSIREAGQI